MVIKRNLSKDNLFFVFLFLLVVLWSLLSLPYSPIAWVDEVILASYTHSFINGNGISMELDHGDPVPVYGPVFFILQAIFVKIFSFSPFGLRLCNCIFAYLSALFLGKIMKSLHVTKHVRYLMMIIYVTDVLFVSNSHSGRMEFVALFFVLTAHWAFFNSNIVKKYESFFISLALSLAFMTTPRVAVICMPIAIAELYRLVKQKRWVYTFCYVLLPVLLYLIWILYAFGSVDAMLDYYLKPNLTSPDASLTDRFINVNLSLFIPKWQYPLILTAAICVIHSICFRYLGKLVLFIIPICLFYLIVFDTGTYSTLIIPFYLLIISTAYTEQQMIDEKKFRIVFKMMLLCCLFVNISIFVVKSISVICTMNSRDHAQMSAWFKKQIPSGSKVAGTYAFYYAAIENACSYRRLEHEYLNAKALHDDLINDFEVEYLVVSEEQFTPEMAECYPLFENEKELVGVYNPTNGDSWLNNMFSDFLRKYPVLSSFPTYACKVYQVKKK